MSRVTNIPSESYLGPAADDVGAAVGFAENDNLFDPWLLFKTVFILDNNPPFFFSSGTFGPVLAVELMLGLQLKGPVTNPRGIYIAGIRTRV